MALSMKHESVFKLLEAHFIYAKPTSATIVYILKWNHTRKSNVIPTGGSIVDEFFSTVPS